MKSSSAAALPNQDAPPGAFTVQLTNYQGPFDLLLALIAKRQLDITEVALAEITDEFIAHIRAMTTRGEAVVGAAALDEISEFLVVAATLLDLKAARLLPSGQVEDAEDVALLEARDLLFARLLQYRAFKQMAAEFSDRLATVGQRVARAGGHDPAVIQLSSDVELDITPEQLADLAAGALRAYATRPPPEPEQVEVAHLHGAPVSVADEAQRLVGQLRRRGVCGFSDLISDAPDTFVIVARFLALLELYRAQVVGFEQVAALGELLVRWVGPAEGAVTMAADAGHDWQLEKQWQLEEQR